MFVPLHDETPLRVIRFQFVTLSIIAANVVIFLMTGAFVSVEALAPTAAVAFGALRAGLGALPTGLGISRAGLGALWAGLMVSRAGLEAPRPGPGALRAGLMPGAPV